MTHRWHGAGTTSRAGSDSGSRWRRALTPEPRILVLDDSTSALDVATESRVQAAIPQFSKNVTTIYVAQRISAVIDLDKIVLMENGKIVDVGKHEELLARSPLYQGIYESQLGKVEGESGKRSTKGTKGTKTGMMEADDEC